MPRRFDAETASDGALPPALFQRIDGTGAVVAEDDPEPLAADLRLDGDGFQIAKLKVIAALTGIPLTLLSERQTEAERRERRIVRWVAGVMGVLTIIASLAAVLALRSAEVARKRLEDAIQIAARRVDDAVQFRDAYGVPIAVIQQLLSGAEQDFSQLIAPEDTRVPTLELQRGRLLVLFSGLYGVIGNSDRQLMLARQGLATLKRVTIARELTRPITWFVRLPTAEELTAEELGALEELGLALSSTQGGMEEAAVVFESGRQLATRAGRQDYIARFWSRLGEHRYANGDVEGALVAHEAAIDVLNLAIEGTPDRDLSIDRALAQSDRAELLLESERHEEALDQQTNVVTIFEARASAAPNDAAALQSLGHALTRRADMRYAVTGQWTRSITEYERALELFERVHASDKARVDYARDLSIALERLGDVMLQGQQLKRASALFNQSADLRRQRLARDPDNTDANRDLAVILERLGDLAVAERRLDLALNYFNEAVRVRTTDDPAIASPMDSVLTRDLAVLLYKTGAARFASGHDKSWIEPYEGAIRLMVDLVNSENAPLGWLRDLAVFRNSYGNALCRANRLPDALKQWRTGLMLIENQLAINAGDPRLQVDRATLVSSLKAGCPVNR
jgi:tetratricopeptide (TPR) repeat protein